MGVRRFVLWEYTRGSWQYDVMVGLILAFIFLAPADWFRAHPRPASVVMIEGHEGSDVWLAPELLAAVPEGKKLDRATRLVQDKFGKGTVVVRVLPILDPEGETTGYMVQVRP